MPRAVVADALGPVENYSLRPRQLAPPGPREVRIAVRAVGVSFVDVLVSAGGYQRKPATPFIPGSECAGVVEALGEEVSEFRVGEPVLATGWFGMIAEAVNAPAGAVRSMPPGLSFEEAAVLVSSYATAFHALKDRGRLQAGETLLVLGAAGATGYAAVQIGAALGARVVASASSAAKRELAIAGGAAAAVDAGSPSWREEVRAANGGRAVDVVFDPVGGDATERAFRTLGFDGRHLIVGFPAGIPAVPTNLPLLKNASLIGVNLQDFADKRPLQSEANYREVLRLASQGALRPAIARTYPLEAFAEAMTAAARGDSAGRVVIVI
jgi:NADPH2:quinone reductase